MSKIREKKPDKNNVGKDVEQQNPHMLLVRRQNATATLENLLVFYRVKHALNI